MNCRDMEKLIALHAEGDLPASDAEGVLGHLETCASCQAFLAKLALSQAALTQFREEPLDEMAVAAWRGAVMGRIQVESPKHRFAWT